MVCVLAGFLEIFETGMILYFLYRDRAYLLCHQSRQAFVNAHAERANTLAA